jgi:hypothetical protein
MGYDSYGKRIQSKIQRDHDGPRNHLYHPAVLSGHFVNFAGHPGPYAGHHHAVHGLPGESFPAGRGMVTGYAAPPYGSAQIPPQSLAGLSGFGAASPFASQGSVLDFAPHSQSTYSATSTPFM